MRDVSLKSSVILVFLSSTGFAAAPAQWQGSGALAVVALKAGLVKGAPASLVPENIDMDASRCKAEFIQPLSHEESVEAQATDQFSCILLDKTGSSYSVTIPLKGTKVLYWGNGYGSPGFRFVENDFTKQLARTTRAIALSTETTPKWMTKVEVCDPDGIDCLLSYFVKRSVSEEGDHLQGLSCASRVKANDERRTYEAYAYDCAFYPQPLAVRETTTF